MARFGYLWADGSVTDIQERDANDTPPAGAQLVEVLTVAAPPGPYVYDAPNKAAVLKTLTAIEKADRAGLPPRLLVALAIKNASAGIATLAQIQWAQNVIDNVATKAIAAIT